jgi:DNA-binding response OmpR family regulator
MALEAEGYCVVAAMDGQEALDEVRRQAPDLIILDVMLPRIDGYEVARFIKSDEKLKGIPIILLTAFTQKRDEASFARIGADCYLKKPFELDRLSGKVKELLGG